MLTKIGIFFAVALLCLFETSCSRQPASAQEDSQQPSQSLKELSGQNFSIFESDETKEKKFINKHAEALFEAREFEKLDALAAQYRQTRECYASGAWKLVEVYKGLQLSETAPDSEWEKRITIFNDWIKARPESITARVALAEELLNYGWKARGSGYANTVSRSGWDLLAERLNRAEEVLDQARHLNDHCPYWHSVMLRAALGLDASRSQYDALFNQAIKAAPDYIKFYGLRAYYLQPRWHGKKGEWEQDLEESCDRIGGEEGDLLYARTVWDMQQTRIFDNIFKESNLSWERIDKGFAIIKKRFPDSLAAKSEHAFLAGLGGPRDQAIEYFDALEGKIDLSIWMDRDEFDSFARWTYKH